MDDEDRRRQGDATRRRVLGAMHVDRALAGTSPFTHEFQDLLTRYAWGEIWTRPDLDERTRRVLAIGTLVALGRWEELKMHARAALEGAVLSPADLKEILLQQAIYCGIPAANAAFAAMCDVVAGTLPQESDARVPEGASPRSSRERTPARRRGRRAARGQRRRS